jgi:hypothetical protein
MAPGMIVTTPTGAVQEESLGCPYDALAAVWEQVPQLPVHPRTQTCASQPASQ